MLVDGTRRLIEAEAAAGVQRHFLISIVGIDRVPMGYYKLKLEQEDVLNGAQGVAVTILRATQFHQLLDMAFRSTSKFGTVPRANIPLQPVDPREVAVALADGVDEGTWDGRREFAGPDIRPLTELARAWKQARGKTAISLPLPLFGRMGSALKAGGLTSTDARQGKVTFDRWLVA